MSADLRLEPPEVAMLEGDGSAAEQMAMRVIVAMAEASGAARLLDVSQAHIDSCLYHGQSGIDFAERLVAGNATVKVPTTLNVSSLDLLHPDLYQGDVEEAHHSRHLMSLYESMGCSPTWTCAPYQLPTRPEFGEHVAWAESNAIVFANSVLGARTNRYGDFIDICAAITGKAPAAGLHLDEGRKATVVLEIEGVPDRLLDDDVLYPVLGHLTGLIAGTRVVAVDGLPAGTSEDRLKALGAAAASSGAVGMFHAVGVTPEAHDLEAALQRGVPDETVVVGPNQLRAARDALTTAATTDNTSLTGVCLGTPHYSVAELARLVSLLGGRTVHPNIECYVSTGRDILATASERGWDTILRDAGIQIVVDTCTYITPILRSPSGVVMTDSAKWAHYAPSNLGVDVVFGSVEECVRSAMLGKVWRDQELWAGG